MASNFEKIVRKGFGVDLRTFGEGIKLSPGAQGYVLGAISEHLLKKLLEQKGYEVERIAEKWKGKKPLRHHGDFYIRKKSHRNWYVFEVKGLKSNSEDWHKLNKEGKLFNFIKKWNKSSKIFNSDKEIRQWCQKNFESDINKLKIRVLETHFVAGRRKKDKREISTSRNDEFDYIAVDLYLRTGNHKFIFARPKDLPPAKSHPKHLQQNYVIDVLLAREKEKIRIQPPWHEDLEEIFDINKKPIKEEKMQINHRAKMHELISEPWLL